MDEPLGDDVVAEGSVVLPLTVLKEEFTELDRRFEQE